MWGRCGLCNMIRLPSPCTVASKAVYSRMLLPETTMLPFASRHARRVPEMTRESLCPQVSTILQGILCEALPNPTTPHGYGADPEGLEEVRDALQMSLDAPTEARPVVVTFCTDGSRSLVVRCAAAVIPAVMRTIRSCFTSWC